MLDLERFNSKFKKETTLIWDPIREKVEEDFRKSGYGVSGVDCLLGGLDRSGKLFLTNICDIHNFEFRILWQTASRFSLPQGPVIDKMIEDKVRDFLGTAMTLDEGGQRTLAKQMLNKLFLEVRRKNRFISLSHDLIFVGTNTEIWSCGWFGHYRQKNVRISDIVPPPVKEVPLKKPDGGRVIHDWVTPGGISTGIGSIDSDNPFEGHIP